MAAVEWMDSHPKVPDDSPVYEAKGSLVSEIETKIAETPAAGLVGAAVKLRRLLDPDLGIEVIDGVERLTALRTALATVERLAQGEQGTEPDPIVALLGKVAALRQQEKRFAAMGSEEFEREKGSYPPVCEAESELLKTPPTTPQGIVLLLQFLGTREVELDEDGWRDSISSLLRGISRIAAPWLEDGIALFEGPGRAES